jgi:hypothetical protein
MTTKHDKCRILHLRVHPAAAADRAAALRDKYAIVVETTRGSAQHINKKGKGLPDDGSHSDNDDDR